MRYAKSMYRGGEIIDASLCDYNSTRQLGLVCPFCSQAVFLRSGSAYERQGKQIIVPDAFAHYHSDDPLSLECELRAKRKEGEDYLNQLRIEAKNQRLKLYNKRLWEIVKRSWPNNVLFLKTVNKQFDKKWIEWNAIRARQELAKDLDFYQVEMEQISKQASRQNVDAIAQKIWSKERMMADSLKYNFVDQQLQLTIAFEVLEFLATKTGGYAFANIFRLGLISIALTEFNTAFQREIGAKEAIALFAPRIKKNYSTQGFIFAVSVIVLFTDWIKLYGELEGDRSLQDYVQNLHI